jgi:hypothetical protein
VLRVTDVTDKDGPGSKKLGSIAYEKHPCARSSSLTAIRRIPSFRQERGLAGTSVTPCLRHTVTVSMEPGGRPHIDHENRQKRDWTRRTADVWSSAVR